VIISARAAADGCSKIGTVHLLFGELIKRLNMTACVKWHASKSVPLQYAISSKVCTWRYEVKPLQ